MREDQELLTQFRPVSVLPPCGLKREGVEEGREGDGEEREIETISRVSEGRVG